MMNFIQFTGIALMAGISASAFAADGEFDLKGNIQTQVTKSIKDEDNNFSSGWIRANIGGQYKSENLDGTIMLRIFAPEFGNKYSTDVSTTTDVVENVNGEAVNVVTNAKASKSSFDKILADLYWVNYKWKPNSNNQLNLKIGHWKTDWSQSTHFGTYLDKDLTKRGLWMRDYAHNAIELGWKNGLNQLNAMVAVKDGNANQGYVRVEENMKFNFPLELKVGYRGNLIDVVQNTAELTHRIATFASYSIVPAFRVYGEYACIYTQNEDVNKDAPNFIASESKYFEPGVYFQPFYLGFDLAPKSGFMNTLMTNLFVEWEYINKRDNLYKAANHTYDDWAWTVAWNKKVGASRLQFSVYSENEMTDVGLAFRLTSTIK